MATVKLDPAKGIQIPNLTTTERNAISSPETGAIIWNTTTSEINQYNGSAWEITYTPVAGITSSADAAAITINSSEDVSFGTTAILPDIDNVEGVAIATGSYDGRLGISRAGLGLAINRKTSDGELVQFKKDSTTVGSIGAVGTEMYIGSPSGSDGFVRFQSLGLLPATSAGANSDATMSLGTSSARFTDLYLSGGLKVGGTGTANTLYDYEEGTWTPTLSSSNSRNGTWSSAIGRYIKIGNMVTLFIDIAGSGMYFTSERGWQSIANLPFSATQPANSQNYAGSWSGNAVAYSMGGSVYVNASSMYLHAANTNWNTSGISGIGVCISYLT